MHFELTNSKTGDVTRFDAADLESAHVTAKMIAETEGWINSWYCARINEDGLKEFVGSAAGWPQKKETA